MISRKKRGIMTYDRIQKLIEKVSDELKSAGIPISDSIDKAVVNKRTKKRLGACIRKSMPDGKESFTIEISERALMCDDHRLSEIIAHELLHTCPNSFDHGKKWKEHGKRAEELLGYHIKRTVKLEEFGIPEPEKAEKAKYTIVCRKCGRRYERKRICPLVRRPERYRCGKCGGRLKLL